MKAKRLIKACEDIDIEFDVYDRDGNQISIGDIVKYAEGEGGEYKVAEINNEEDIIIEPTEPGLRAAGPEARHCPGCF